MTGARIAIGTRGSALALAQAALVRDAFAADGRLCRLVIIETAGDRRAPDTAWGEGAFVAAIERALLDGRVDVAVHSAKDVPIEQDRRLRIAAYLPRADARDALVVRSDSRVRSLLDLEPGSRVGTDSPRRAGFVRAIRPDVVVHPLHGNVDTRLARLDAGATDALVLACAGLDRLGRGDRIVERLATDAIPPAPGQGAIAVQIRSNDARMLGLTAAIDDRRTRLAVEAERAVLEAADGGCRTPIGAFGSIVGPDLELLAGYAAPDGSAMVIRSRRGSATRGRELAAELWAELASLGAVATRDDSEDVPARRVDLPGPLLDDAGHGVRRFRVLVARPGDQADELVTELRKLQMEPILVPAIAIDLDPDGRLGEVAAAIDRFAWVVVTSANAARALIDAGVGGGSVGGPARGGTRPRWAAIGAMTARVLADAGIRVDFAPSTSDGATLGRELPIKAGDAVLLPRGDLASDALPSRLRSRGADVEEVIAYRTRLAPAGSGPLLHAALAVGAIDAVVLTSGSTAHGLAEIGAREGVDVRSIAAICIGPETTRVAAEAGFRVVATAPAPDAATLAKTVAGVVAAAAAAAATAATTAEPAEQTAASRPDLAAPTHDPTLETVDA